MAAARVQDMSIDDVRVLCIRQNILADDDVVLANKVDGNKLLKFRNPTALMRLIGTRCIGDAVHLLSALTVLETERRLLPPRLTEDSSLAPGASSWNMAETANWLNRVRIPGLVPIFERHRITGDVLLQLDLECFAAIEEQVLEWFEPLEEALAELRRKEDLAQQLQILLPPCAV